MTDVVTGLSDRQAAKSEKKDAKLAGKIEQRSIKQEGKQDEISIRKRMLDAASSINAAVGASGFTSDSGTSMMSQQQAKGQGIRDIIASGNTTQTLLLESMSGTSRRVRSAKSKERAGLIRAGAGAAEAYYTSGNRGG